MATLRTVIIDTDAGATSSNLYTGLAEAELAIRTANETDLVSRDEYIEFRCTGSSADTTAVTFNSSSWVTSEDNYIAIIANDNHNGQWNENIYRFDVAACPANAAIYLVGMNFIRIIGLQIRQGSAFCSGRHAIYFNNCKHGFAQVHRNYIVGNSGSMNYGSSGIYYNVGSAPASQSIEVTSNVLEGWTNLNTGGPVTASVGVGIDFLQYGNRWIYNNTIINCSTGSSISETGADTWFENNLAYGNGRDFSLSTLDGSNDYNASGDSTAVGSNSLTNISNPFVDYDNRNYILRSQSPLVDAGNYQSASLEDVRGKTRVGIWDIGAFENFHWARLKPPTELVTNGGFDTDTNWTKQTWTIGSGVASAVSLPAGNSLSHNDWIYQPGHTYRVKFTVSNYTQGNIRVRIGQSTPSGQFLADGDGDYVFDIVSGPGVQYLEFTGNSGDFTGDIDNVSVKEIKTIIKPPTELVTNGGFDTNTDWTSGSWFISGGQAHHTSGSGYAELTQFSVMTPGDYYKVEFDVISVSSFVRPYFGNQTIGVAANAPGHWVDYGYASGSSEANASKFFIAALSAEDAVIDNVTLTKVKTIIK